MRLKRPLLILFAGAFLCSLCFSQQIPLLSTQSDLIATSGVFSGKVGVIFPVDEGKKNAKRKGKIVPAIVVTDENGERRRFKLTADTVITAKNGKKLSSRQIKAGDRVTLSYITDAKKGVYEAASITRVKNASILNGFSIFKLISFGGGKQ